MNKFYLKKAKLIHDREGKLYYRLLYSNGIIKKYEFIKFDVTSKIDIELI
jgi:hypothetical protein